MTSRDQVYLSAPSVTQDDIDSVVEAMRSGWVAPVGPALDAFEQGIAAHVGVRFAVALSSGTAGLHLGLKYLGVSQGDLVIVPSVTFAATAFAVNYLGAQPLFIDVDPIYGTLDPSLVEQAFLAARKLNRRIAAIVPVDLYGTPVDYSELLPVVEAFQLPMLEDAAEGLGGSLGRSQLGSFGNGAVLSFNGNKILTTSGGGMILTDDEAFATRIRKWSTQSREDFPWYEHYEIGYNYRMSNLLAALGLSQLSRIDAIVSRRREVRTLYASLLAEHDEVSIPLDPPWGVSNAWLTVALFEGRSSKKLDRIRSSLEALGIESRNVWKPMHTQPVFFTCPTVLNGSADGYYSQGLCLPSGPHVTDSVIYQVSDVILSVVRD